MDMGISDSGAPTRATLLSSHPSVDSPPTTLWNAGLLFDVDVDQLARMRGLDAPDYSATLAVQVAQTAQSVPDQYSMQRRGWDARPRSQSGRAQAVTST
jgi:hypothetical protein